MNYIEPLGWAGTPGPWLPAENERSVHAGEIKIDLWPSEYGRPGGGYELQANIAAIANLKEALKALEPFAALGAEVPEGITDQRSLRIKVNIGDLRRAAEVLRNSIPTEYKPSHVPEYKRTGDLNVKP